MLAALTTYLVCMPLILIFGQIRGAYLGGSILAFFLGYSMLFFKGGILASIYPFSAALILVGFDMSGYAGTTTAPNPLLAVIGVGIMVLWAVLLLLMSSNKKEIKSRKQANSKGKESVLYAGKEGDTCEENSSIIMLDTVGRFCAFRLYKR